MTDAAALIAQALQYLDMATAEGSGDARHAAALLRGAAERRGGRPQTDDAALVAEVERLGGGAEAIAAVAAGDRNTVKRLRRKCLEKLVA